MTAPQTPEQIAERLFRYAKERDDDEGCEPAPPPDDALAEAKEAALTIMVELGRVVADAAVVGRTYGWPEVLGVVMAAQREILRLRGEASSAPASQEKTR